ncbi:subtilase family protein [Herbihabitans rhizosphaerae]|uniref:Subtilase family protein n=1 Tax=Herbihabitans rhizosphaerae TaxID=1872711 RepID=A0A4Q7KD89_9PSEU|nr:S8 family serine peptidase [Herbihabitans rhizosphaerae]RZS29539.1 subtilase family protein [Herbihabitans rhizosphaerae]
MHHRNRGRSRAARFGLAGLAVAAVTTAVVIPVVSDGTAEAAPAPAVGQMSAPARSVTLITGDRVLVAGRDQVRVHAAPGREAVGFHQQVEPDGDVHVIPLDAMPLVSAGRLDRRLFDVTGLIEAGYDDSARQDIPVIVSYPAGAPRAVRAEGARTERELPSINATALRVGKTGTAFWNASTRGAAQRISLDGRVRATLDHSVPQIGAPEAWNAGHTGKGATVAVLDTGIDATHPDLADAVVEAKDFSGSPSGADDKQGHGTHVASTVTGSGVAEGGKRVGVAPDARLLVGKVLDDRGSGSESGIIAGMEWAAGKGARVINMSLGSSQASDGTDSMSQAVNRLTEQTGALFVVAAGNSGSARPMGSPAAADAALTVGAVDGQDKLARFSSQGPRHGDAAIKPDITAPGVDIVAARAKDAQIGEPVGDKYVKLSGTSMATPHIAGAAAILAAQHPDWKPDRIKAALMASAKPNAEATVFQQGAGRVDVARAHTQTVAASPGSVSLGRARWPHDDDKPVAKPLTYNNFGPQPITVTLTAEVRDPAGNPAPESMFTVEPRTLTIPAGGQAGATVTANTAVAGPDGVYSGQVVATGGPAELRTPVAVDREVESYDVKISVIGSDGTPRPGYSMWLFDVDRMSSVRPHDPSGTVTARVPKGRYFAHLIFVAGNGPDAKLIQAAEPEIVVDRNLELTFDARQGKPVGFQVDKPEAKAGMAVLTSRRQAAKGSANAILTSRQLDGVAILPSKTVVPQDKFEFSAEGRLAQPAADGTFTGSPYLYNLRWSHGGQVPQDLVRRFRDADLARVRSEYAAQAPGRVGVREAVIATPLPFGLDEFYATDQPIYDQFYEEAAPGQRSATVLLTPPRTYRKGETRTERWNAAVFGPAFASTAGSRLRDRIGVSVPLYSDQAPDHESIVFSGADGITGRTTLLRDGTPIGEVAEPGGGQFTLPPDDGRYLLRTEAVRKDGSPLSTKITAEWGFQSSHVDGEQPKPLPLLAVRLAPPVDATNTAPAGQRFTIPVYVQRNGSPPGRVEPPNVRVSYDGGATWRPVPISPDGDRWTIALDHPADAKSVSIAAGTRDSDGNTVDHTIMDAYRLK